MGEGTVFSMSVHTSTWRGVPIHSQWGWEVLPSFLTGGGGTSILLHGVGGEGTHILPDGGTPILPNGFTLIPGQNRGCPHPRSEWEGTPILGQNGGTPHPRSGEGYLIPGQYGGTPSQVKMGWGLPPSQIRKGGAPLPDQDRSQVRVGGYPSTGTA